MLQMQRHTPGGVWEGIKEAAADRRLVPFAADAAWGGPEGRRS